MKLFLVGMTPKQGAIRRMDGTYDWLVWAEDKAEAIEVIGQLRDDISFYVVEVISE